MFQKAAGMLKERSTEGWQTDRVIIAFNGLVDPIHNVHSGGISAPQGAIANAPQLGS